jgi:hypothetical protein
VVPQHLDLVSRLFLPLPTRLLLAEAEAEATALVLEATALPLVLVLEPGNAHAHVWKKFQTTIVVHQKRNDQDKKTAKKAAKGAVA